jgi:ATP-dependent Clp endopeptidase proteolytic subunit ClpP
MRQSREWYRLRNLGPTSAELYIYDEIGFWGTSASDLVAALSEMQGVTTLDVHVNSPGGDVFDGLAIMNCLRAHSAQVTTYVDGIAASIASVIAMAGDRIVMGPHSQMMIHDASGLCIGNASDMTEMAQMLAFQSDNIAAVYAERAGGTVEDWRAHMTAESWYTAEEAVAAGLADEVAQRPAQAAAGVPMDKAWDLTIFAYAGRDAAPDPVIDTATPASEPVPEDVSAEPVGTGQDEAAAGPGVLPPDAPEPAAPTAAIEDEHGPEPVELAPAAEPEPDVPDPWAAAVARLTTPPAEPTVGDLLAALREA